MVVAGHRGFDRLRFVLAMAAGPPVAERLGAADNFQFVKRQMLVLPLAVSLLFVASLLTPRQVRVLAVPLFACALLLLVVTVFAGVEIKGARRWLSVAGFSLQPSEFVKPAFILIAAWVFAARRQDPNFPGYAINLALCLCVVGLLTMQPDLGQAFVVTSVWIGQFFLAGLSLWVVAVLGLCGIAGLVGAYFAFPHVASRIDRYLDPAIGDNYQVEVSLRAFREGGLFGRGPGEGTVKAHLPDAHADFVFAVAGEELGLIACVVIVALFTVVVLRGFTRVLKHDDPVRGAGGCRPAHAVWPAGAHQYGHQPQPYPDQGHDAAIHLLWRFVVAGDLHRPGLRPGPDPACRDCGRPTMSQHSR